MMKKGSNTWIAAGLLTIVAVIAVLYCLLEYRGTVWILGISSLLLLLAAFWLFTCLAKRKPDAPSASVGEEQRERMNYEGMKLQGEELIRLTNTLGKGTYLNTRHTAQELKELNDRLVQNQAALEELVQALLRNQTKAAKLQIKYHQDDTTRLLQALSDPTVLTGTADVRSSGSPDIAASLQTLSAELAHINDSIQALQLRLQMPTAEAAPAAESTAEPEPTAKPTPESILEAASAAESAAEPEPAAEPAPEPISEATPAAESTTEPKPAAEPTPEPILEAVPAAESAAEPEPGPEAAAAEDVPEPETADTSADVSAILSDDPNKQLSADEIAALFAALG